MLRTAAELCWRDRAGRRRLMCGDEVIGTVRAYRHPGVTHVDKFTALEDGVFLWERRFTVAPQAARRAYRLTMEFVAEHRSTYSLIPPISFNGNEWGTGLEPKGFFHDGAPWSFASDRTSVPAATYSEGPGWSVALLAETPIAPCGCACSLAPAGDQTIHRLIWPEEEQPVTYSERDAYSPGYAQVLELEPGASFSARALLVVAPVETPRFAWRRMLDVAWERNHRHRHARLSPDDVWKLGVRFAKESLWAEEGVFRGFSIGLHPDENGVWMQRAHSRYESGWAGQNISLANSLLHDYVLHGDSSSLEMGLACLDCWVLHGRLPNGAVRAIFDPVLGRERSRDTQDACNLGTAAEHLFEAHRLATRCGCERPEYRDAALAACDFAVAQQDDRGCFGRAWTVDGQLLDRDGTVGAFFIPPLIEAYRATQQPRYLEGATRAYRFYVRELVDRGYTTAGALDSHCIDKESAYPLLDAGVALYEITGEDEFLTAAEHTAYYIALWQWHHTLTSPPGSSLAALDFDTFGNTSVSAQHHHMDPWGARFVNASLRLSELTGKPAHRQRATEYWRAALEGVSDGSLVLQGMTYPPGAQSEGFFHTRWIDHGGVSLWLVAWPTAFRLETLRRRDDWSFFWG